MWLPRVPEIELGRERQTKNALRTERSDQSSESRFVILLRFPLIASGTEQLTLYCFAHFARLAGRPQPPGLRSASSTSRLLRRRRSRVVCPPRAEIARQ